MVLSSKPAILLLDDRLLVFKRIEASKVTPFLTWKYVEVPLADAEKVPGDGRTSSDLRLSCHLFRLRSYSRNENLYP